MNIQTVVGLGRVTNIPVASDTKKLLKKGTFV